MALALGKPDRALPWFAATGGEAGRFWWAVAVRHMGAARVSVAGAPGRATESCGRTMRFVSSYGPQPP